jgi:RNA polymerase sigma-70 factor (sigma-E family)
MAALFDGHSEAALRLAYLLTGSREQAEDLVQDAFVRMFGRWQELRNPEAFRAYLNKTVVNLARNYYRRKGLERRELERERAGGRKTAMGIPDVEGREELLAALSELPHRQRAAVALRFLEDMSEQQTAHALDCSVSAVKTATSRGMAALRERLGGERK